MESIIHFFGVNGFMPHGYCLRWTSGLLWLHVVSDSLIVFAYYSIPITLGFFVSKRKDLPYPWIFKLFALFIIACGTTHLFSIITIWFPLYWLDGITKAITAISSLLTAGLMFWLMPRLLSLRSPAELQEALDRLNKVASQLPGAVFQYRLRPDGSSCFPYVSEGFHQLYGGLSPLAVREDAAPLFSRIHPDDLESLKASIQVSAENLSPWVHEYRSQVKGQADRWLLGNSVPQIEADGSTLWHGFITDITERKAVDQKLRDLSVAVEQSPASVAITNLDGSIAYVNESFVSITGFNKEDVLGKTSRLLQSGLTSRAIYRELWSTVTQGKIWHGELFNKKRNGTTYWADTYIAPVRDDHDEITHYVGVSLDISERKRVENELREKKLEIETLNQQLEQRVEERTGQLLATNQELQAFSYSVSHDLRGPLHVIAWFTQMMLAEHASVIPVAAQHQLDRIVRAVKRMEELINDLLELSQVGSESLRLETIDLGQMAVDILTELQQIEPDRQANFRIASDLNFQCDSRLMKIALENLLANAWKFTRCQDVTEIEFGTLPDVGKTIFFVRDNGVGFDPQYAQKLFGPFQRLHSQQDFEGTGIGLATVQRIILRHGGLIWAESQPGAGATFFFKI